MSDHRGILELDPAERLAAALNRIAVASERREGTPATGPGVGPVAADLDGLIARLRGLLDGMPGGTASDSQASETGSGN